ncbi:hypothetical protein HPB50_017283 [Hyalomma asiaticum]|uniref:Uncharacterized protein n=1 Tax=Hyalomma asiaticum TaxID=266040 RepID=A0ACB7RMG0_HYAAI|nr:hypothetical protein HPB50_017283 [Hyalomma asiaticum]
MSGSQQQFTMGIKKKVIEYAEAHGNLAAQREFGPSGEHPVLEEPETAHHNTFQEFVDAGDSELAVCEEASTNDAIIAAVHGSAEVATDDNSDSKDNVDTMPEPDFSSKDALEYLTKVKAYCAKKSLSEKLLQCFSSVEDETVRRAVHKHCQMKITAFFR